MADDGKGCLKGCGLGCAAALLVAVGLIVVGSVTIVAPLRRAEVDRTILDDAYGGQDAFTPTADGGVGGDRVEAFLAVREALAPTCEGFTHAEEEFAKIEAFDEQENPSKVEAMGQALRTSRAAFGIGPLMGQLYRERNRSLLEHDMGLGEYTYIYVMAYHDRLNGPAAEGNLVFDGPVLNRRLAEIMREMLTRQRAGLDTPEAADAELAEALDAELERLGEDGSRVPWQDGLPPSVAASLEPYRDRLDASYCRAMAPVELLQNRRRALAFESY